MFVKCAAYPTGVLAGDDAGQVCRSDAVPVQVLVLVHDGGRLAGEQRTAMTHLAVQDSRMIQN